MTSSLTIFGPLVLTAVAFLLFFGFLFAIYYFLRWLWGGLPTMVVSVRADQLDKILGLLLSLLFFPNLVLFAWSTAQALVNYIPELIGWISSFQVPISCTRSGQEDSARCVSEFSAILTKFVGASSSRLVATLNLAQFPAANFVWFLLAAVITTQVISAVHQAATIQRVGSWYATAREIIPGAFWQRLTFAILVLVSFYLGLCALLAVPLFQDKSRPQQLTVEALGKALETNIIKSDLFDQRFPMDSPALREPPLPKLTGTEAEQAAVIFNIEISNKKRMWQDLQVAWSALRATAAAVPTASRDQATNAFAAGLEVSAGKKQTAQYYNDLFLWHQRLSQLTRDALSRCQSAITSFVLIASQSSDSLRAQLEAAKEGTLTDAVNQYMQQQQRTFFPAYESARRLCYQPDDEEKPRIPQRLSFADTLGPVGGWTRWLLDTEQMPVVIIVGLVGFSLLGATVSRAVRATGENLKAGLTLDDLLTVVAGGMTAAVVVFLAAYGGLAVLGNSAGDPNPYVVFVTCLIGAVYSEDVWSWARKRVLASQMEAEDRSRRTVARDQDHDGAESQGGKPREGT